MSIDRMETNLRDVRHLGFKRRKKGKWLIPSAKTIADPPGGDALRFVSARSAMPAQKNPPRDSGGWLNLFDQDGG